MSQRIIKSDPVELTFENVEPDKYYTSSMTLHNTSPTSIEISLKPCPTLDRDYEISPNVFQLRGNSSIVVQISVVTSKLGLIRDVIHIVTPSFTEKVYVNVRGPDSNSHYKAIVQDKEDQLQSSQSRVERLEEEIEELSEKLRLANLVISEKARVEQEFASVQQENSELRGLVQELRGNEIYNSRLKEMMQEKIPSLENLIELTLQQEREKNERKNEKVLEILQIKDSLIEDLEEKCEDLQNALTLMQHKLNDNKVLLSNHEKSLQSSQKVIEDLKMKVFEKDQIIGALKGQGGVVKSVPSEDALSLRNEVMKSMDHVKRLSETLEKYELENAKLREREEYVLELSNRHSKIKEDHEKIIKDKELMITELKAKITVQSEHMESLMLKVSQMNYSDILNKVSRLEEENKNLSKMLADSHRSSDTFKQEDLDDEGGKIQTLEGENNRLLSSLKEVTEQSARLEGLISQKNKEIINLQNELIEHKRIKSEILLKAAPSPAEDLNKLAMSLREEQQKALQLEEEKTRLSTQVKTLENTNRLLNSDISSLFDNLENNDSSSSSSQNQLISKIGKKIQKLKEKEQEALKAAAIAEEGIKVLQCELSQENGSEAIKDVKRLSGEMEKVKLRNELLLASNNKLKEEIEGKRQMIAGIQLVVNGEEKKKGKKKGRVPNRIVKALIAAKVGEAEAVKKLKEVSKYDLEFKEKIAKKDEVIKSLEKKLKTGDSESEIEIPEYKLQKRVTELELQLQDLRENDLQAWAEYSPLSLMWKNEPKKVTEDTEIIIEGFLHLLDQFVYEVPSSPRSEASHLIEKSQRVIIKSLIKSQKVFSSEEKLTNILNFQPSREEDRKIWYIELLESELKQTELIVKNLLEITNKSGELQGNTSVIGSVRGASIELAKMIKETADEMGFIKTICVLIRNDIENVAGEEGKARMDEYSKRLNEEIKLGTIHKTREIKELKQENEALKRDLQEITGKCLGYSGDIKSFQVFIAKNKNKIEMLETEKGEMQKSIERLCAEVEEISEKKQQAQTKLEKVHSEMKEWQERQIETLTSRERTILDLQSQLKHRQEAPQSPIFASKMENSEDLIQEIKSLQAEIDDLQKELFSTQQNACEERRNLITKISELEETIFYMNKSDDFKGNLGTTLKKDPDIQICAIQALLREKISLLDEEMRKRLDLETKLRDLILTESEAEKGVILIQNDLENKVFSLEKEVENYGKENQLLREEKDELMNRYEKVTQSLRETMENLRITEREMLALQQENKAEALKYTTKLQSTAHSSVELKGKVKDLTESTERLQKENEALYAHLKALEGEYESTALKLADMEKVNSNVKLKLKDYEQNIEDLEEIRTIEGNNYLASIEALKGELKRTYQEFEKTIEQFDGQIISLKEQYYNELKQKKSAKKASETIDFMLQISKKDSIIKSLKTELKSVKPKKLEKKTLTKPENPQKEEQNIILQNQVYKLKAQVRNLESQLSVNKEEFERVSQEIESRPASEPTSKKEIVEIEKRHRNDMQKLAEEVARVREKWHSPEEWTNLLSANKDLENSLKRINEELSRKRDIVDSLKAIKDQQDYENNAIQEELEQVKDYSEKVRKLKIEVNRKDKAICEMKNALENYKETEKKIIEDNTQMCEKMRGLKNDVARKEVLIKELKNRIENSGLENLKNVSEECENLKDKIRKLKSDCERKDLQLKNIKAKLETAEIELEAVQTERQNLSTDAFASLEKEVKKNEKLQMQLKKIELQFASLFEVTRRIFKELSDSVENLRSKAGQGIDKEYYSDCMDILNMDMKDLSEFVGHKSVGTMICRIERLLEQGENTAEVIEIFNRLLDERLELEKSTNQFKGKNEGGSRSRTAQGYNKKNTFKA